MLGYRPLASLPAVAAAVLAGFAAPGRTSAHSRLVDPPSRSESDSLTDAPCGGVPVGSARTRFEAGEAIVLRWVLTQNHSSLFRVAFSPAGDEGFDDRVLGTRPDEEGVLDYEQALTLPKCVCDECTLQLLQYSSPTMLEGYYSCADIELVQPPGGGMPECAPDQETTATAGKTTGGSTEGTSGGLMGGGSTTSTSTTTTPEVPGPARSASSGCAIAPTSGSPALFGLAIVAMGRRRQR